MIFREARTSDIQQLKLVRQCVKENVLSDPLRVTEYDYLRYLTIDGKGWVCVTGNKIIGFGIIDCNHRKIWALFVKPAYTGKRVGKTLHDVMLNWYFKKKMEKLCLTTYPHTRAEQFYKLQGWTANGRNADQEIIFEMQYTTWKALQAAKNN